MTRPQASCAGCGESVDAPDSDLGRAVVAAFEEQHRGHTKPFTDHPFRPGRFSQTCQVQLARYPCPYPAEAHPATTEGPTT